MNRPSCARSVSRSFGLLGKRANEEFADFNCASRTAPPNLALHLFLRVIASPPTTSATSYSYTPIIHHARSSHCIYPPLTHHASSSFYPPLTHHALSFHSIYYLPTHRARASHFPSTHSRSSLFTFHLSSAPIIHSATAFLVRLLPLPLPSLLSISLSITRSPSTPFVPRISGSFLPHSLDFLSLHFYPHRTEDGQYRPRIRCGSLVCSGCACMASFGTHRNAPP